MKSKLITQLENVLPKDMQIPEELRLLYKWIEENNFYIDDENGKRVGLLYSPQSEPKGTIIRFTCDEKDTWYWFDDNQDLEFKERFCCFATSADGSMCGLWKSDTDEIKIVHIGSGSGSTLLCILANNMLGFIRFLAIGYSEICWEEEFSISPYEEDPNLERNIYFENWVTKTFNIEIPQIATEIIKYSSTMEDDYSKDEFFNWCKSKFRFLE
ncbi:hypothetical protein [Phocoenobacter atlanticus]|uniref:hypothetical protein n=1 Tax=Phocoenobacter atlanticus TaxID=3416742 RepID=UPI00274512EA|nr:hypothetical protein [Pasteurella atlantica]MDP8100837.1 hypothetical protein [Pasteurella atlantica]